MANSKLIAGLIGPTLVAFAVATLLNLRSFPEFSSTATLIFVTGILMFVAGVAIVRSHNNWKGGWPLVVTILGWLAVLGGLVRLFFPIHLAANAGDIGRNTGLVVTAAVVFLLLGGFLSFKGYSRD
jgi:uncharacterized membrane protein HdeD (DUF308 family)